MMGTIRLVIVKRINNLKCGTHYWVSSIPTHESQIVSAILHVYKGCTMRKTGRYYNLYDTDKPKTKSPLGHVNEYPAMHYFGNPRHSQSMITYIILTEYSGNSSVKLHCGTLINMPYSILSICILV